MRYDKSLKATCKRCSVKKNKKLIGCLLPFETATRLLFSRQQRVKTKCLAECHERCLYEVSSSNRTRLSHLEKKKNKTLV